MELAIAIIGLITAVLALIAGVISFKEAKEAKKDITQIKSKIENTDSFKHNKQTSKGDGSPNINAGGNVTTHNGGKNDK